MPATNYSCPTSSDTCDDKFYSATVFTQKAQDVIRMVAATAQPLFLYVDSDV